MWKVARATDLRSKVRRANQRWSGLEVVLRCGTRPGSKAQVVEIARTASVVSVGAYQCNGATGPPRWGDTGRCEGSRIRVLEKLRCNALRAVLGSGPRANIART